MGKYILVSKEGVVIESLDTFEIKPNGMLVNEIIYPPVLELDLVEFDAPDYVRNCKFKFENSEINPIEERMNDYEKVLRGKAKEDLALDIANDGTKLKETIDKLYAEGKVTQTKVEALTTKMKLTAAEKDAIVNK
jgi:hypothetical protein